MDIAEATLVGCIFLCHGEEGVIRRLLQLRGFFLHLEQLRDLPELPIAAIRVCEASVDGIVPWGPSILSLRYA
jgi:hypothetical protein